MTDQEINEAVARKLGDRIRHDEHCCPIPDYCHSIAAAWEIVEHTLMKYAFEIHSTPTNYIAHFSGPTWKQLMTAEADAAPMAICLAFLKLPCSGLDKTKNLT